MSTSAPDKSSGGEERKDSGQSGSQLAVPDVPTKRKTATEVLNLPERLSRLESIEEHSEKSSRIAKSSRRGSDNTIRP